MRKSILFASFFLAAALFSKDTGKVHNCVNGMAKGEFPCMQTALLAKVDLKKSGRSARKGNDIWGWTDPETGKEYAIMGLNNKTSFVDVSNPTAPVHLADLPTKTVSSTWRDIKVYKNYAFIVSEARSHGMQIFDLTKLRKVKKASAPMTYFNADAHYQGFGSAHNIVINEDSGFAYAAGTKTCDQGLHIVDIRNPLKPKFSACIDRDVFEPYNPLASTPEDGETYTHDAQCVNYNGPDERYAGREICVCSNEDSVNIVDVTDKSNPSQISVLIYDGTGYTHQGWLSEEHDIFFLGDETDELSGNHPTKTIIMDLTDLEKPKVIDYYLASTKAVDHNMYVKGKYLYQANYEAGLRILDTSEAKKGILKEVAFFDTVPNSDRAQFRGAWSVFPYYKSGIVVIGNIDGYLYVVSPTLQ